jgi:hypothetical protein
MMLTSWPERPEALGNMRSMMTELRDTELIGDDERLLGLIGLMGRMMMSRRSFRAARGTSGTPVAAAPELAGARVSGFLQREGTRARKKGNWGS